MLFPDEIIVPKSYLQAGTNTATKCKFQSHFNHHKNLISSLLCLIVLNSGSESYHKIIHNKLFPNKWHCFSLIAQNFNNIYNLKPPYGKIS